MEIFDIVDENGAPTGKTVSREEAHAKGLRHRTVHIWVVREVEGKLQVLLQKRALDKDSFPGRLDTSSAGHMQAGDEPLESAQRELAEELGIFASDDELEYAGKFRGNYQKVFHDKLFKDNEVAFVFVYRKPVDIEKLTLQKEELDSVVWYDFDTTYEECKKHNKDFCVPLGGLDIIREYFFEKF